MKNENYINIQGWMINELKLKGNELILYALIYGFSQDGKNKFKGSISYIMVAMSLSNRCVIDLIEKLVKRGLIIKTISNSGNQYQSVKKVHTCEESSQACEESSQPTCEESSHNNNIYNNISNNSFTKVKEATPSEPELIPFDENGNAIEKKIKKDNRNPEIEKLYNLFEKEFGIRPPSIRGGNGFDLNRGSASRMIKKFGIDELTRMISAVFQFQKKDNFIKKCTNPLEFEKNFASYQLYFNKLKQKINNQSRKA